MNKKLIFGSALALILVGSGTLFLLLNKSGDDALTTEQQYDYESDFNLSEKETEVVEDVVEEPLEVEAEKESTPEKTGVEYMKEALDSNNDNLCHEIANNTLRNKCFDGVRLNKALSMNDVKVCNGITNEEDQIYCVDQVVFKLAIANKDFSECNNISDPTLNSRCVAASDKNLFIGAQKASECQKIEDEQLRANCASRFHVYDKKTSDNLCGQLDDEQLRQDCEDKIIANNAVLALNENLCLQIDDQQREEDCLSSIQYLKEEKLAQEIAESGKPQDCGLLKSANLKASCRDQANFYAMRSYKDISYCENIVDIKLQVRCYEDEQKINIYWKTRAEKENNVDFCKNITNNSIKRSCEYLF